ncbi:S1/P1 nuclease [Aquimonas voraii]|uniref:S1/P1 Nuclease n=1 Tax=Aquimonas voraii TaxID=265719 RepID=A0A1G6RVJ8_9GAMM|nr:S1/P1 nuclease [Aquimonas voraii]SDD07956.1 S1/P1 Nuclease [Aquimonas voraii]
MLSAFRLTVTLILLGLAAPPDAAAWNFKGHQTIGELAEQQLSAPALAAVRELLKNEPSNSLAAVSTWPDEVRSEEAWRHTARWHFVNFPEGDCRYRPRRDCADGQCIVAALEAQRAVLRNASSPRGQRSEALKFVTHLVGDIHQPLHAGYGFDRGGNDTQIRFNRMGSNLHALWDGMLVDTLELDRPALVQRLSRETLPEDGGVGRGAAARWAEQSCALIESARIYPEKRFIDRSYVERSRPVAEAQMRLAAARLAAVLEADLGR